MKFNLYVVFALMLMLSACQCNRKPDAGEIKKNMVYFKDEKTGLCFAAVNSANTRSLTESTSIACVPCDSLKKIKLK